MVNLELLSDNLAIIIKEIVNNQDIVKLLIYDNEDPLSQQNVGLPLYALIKDKVYPYPFDLKATVQDCSQIRVYFEKADIDETGFIAEPQLVFDVIVAKSLWLTSGDKEGVRPYLIVDRLVKHFRNKSISTVGKLHFLGFDHYTVNEKFDCIKLYAAMGIIGGEG